ncbi:permease YjgP/YjgQ family protein [Rhodothermus marinus SG0.5JP17-172]|uniref:LptF/LptG family permease n=1 Tax=Rhodothermus marinus TaxID=29549 RepID=UPI000223DA7B|nr:LptF/LptG family permease [Rhodothermus marinus]AEN73020.1 permease YjgP/YjgQ family protein [Rhodothermus marinus SG0.5JP17-172]MBO2492245.1 YjgP/YjgQ family permease [Rhodothermus marinus]
MTLIDRHIVRRLLLGYLFFTGALIVFFIVLHYVEYIDDFMDRGASMREVFLVYYPSYIPEIVRLTSPLALFLACLYVTGRMAQGLEIVALQMSGVSLYRLLRPYVALALVVTGFMFWFNGWVVPVTNRTVVAFDEKYLSKTPRQFDLSHLHRQARPGQFLSVGYYDRERRIAYRIALQQFAEGRRLAYRLDAPRMEWNDSLQAWEVPEGIARHFEPDGREVRRPVRRQQLDLPLYPRDLARTEREVEAMTLPDAAAHLAALRRSGAGHLGRPLVAYYSKFAYPFANLILVLIGVPLASVRRRGGQAIQIGIGLGVAFAYLALQKLIEPFGYTETLPPLLVAWLPHLVFLAGALVLVARTRT